MADESIYGYLDTDPTEEETRQAGSDVREEWGAQVEARGGDPRDYYNRMSDDYYRRKTQERSAELGIESGRKAAGLEGDRLFEYASRLAETAEGQRKTEGQVRAERALEILTGAQRGRAKSQAGFDTATALRQGSRAAQHSEAVGEEQIGAAAELAQEQAGASLEQLLIAGEQRAEDKAFAMAQLQQQRESAEEGLWGNVLGGILGAVGGIVGGLTGGPAGAAAGATGGQAIGQGAGRWVA